MNKTLKIALASMLAVSSLSGVALAQTAAATTMAPMADDGVSIVRIDTLNTDSTRGQFADMKLKATDTSAVQKAQAEVQADPALSGALAEENLELSFVIAVQTAANGGKIVYVR